MSVHQPGDCRLVVPGDDGVLRVADVREAIVGGDPHAGAIYDAAFVR